MDTEKLKDLLLTDEEINKTRNRSIPQANVKIPDFKDSQEWLLWCDREMCKAQILKLLQAGWGDLKESQARIKELEKQNKKLKIQTKSCEGCDHTIAEELEQAKAEARQQALKAFKDWGNERCPHFKDTNLHSYPVIYSLKRGCDKCWNEYFEGDLPKESK